MMVLFFAIFLLLALAAIGFAVWPLLHRSSARGRFLLAGALAALVLGLSVGCYVLLGSPALALRDLTGPSNDDIRGLVAVLARRVLETPDNPRGWTLLGRGYLTLNDPSDAAAAFKRAIEVTPPAQRGDLLSAYAEALTLASGNEVPPEAEAAFRQALKLDPKDRAARFYLGQMAAERGNHARALALWKSLLQDVPANSTLHGMLVNRIAMLSVNAPPDVHAMVEGLAQRLKSNPHDAAGWRRLVRAYSVLGEKDKARAALKDGRAALKSDAAGLAALNDEAKNDRL